MPRVHLVAAAVALAAAVASGCDREALDAASLRDPATCASCHPDQYREWAGSMHAHASDDPVFLALNRVGQRMTDGAIGNLCAGCHAPASVAAGISANGTDLGDLPREYRGVGCWACHAIDDVAALHNGGMVFADDGVERGGIGDPVPTPAHGSKATALLDGRALRSSDACGACHDVVLGNGTAVEATYAEWTHTVFGPGGDSPLSCAACHMVGRDAPAADLPGMPVRRVHEHTFAGVDMALEPWPEKDAQRAAIDRDLAGTLGARLCVIPGAGGVEVQVTLDNQQAGHAFPSGVTHARRVWVELTARSGGVEVWRSGHFEPGEPVDTATDPTTWVLGTRFLDVDGVETPWVWLAAAIDGELLPPAVTNDRNDPRFYHAVTRTWAVAGVPDEVDLAVRMEPIALQALDGLIAEGELDPAIRDLMPRFELTRAARAWRQDLDGWGCAPANR